jgi:RHS repeat-associated protein
MDSASREGYTFQTVLGSMGLNHMNGRVQDAVTGRFLSADPQGTNPINTQSYNRYSYVNNNPLTLTDPTGFYCGDPPAVPQLNGDSNGQMNADGLGEIVVEASCTPPEVYNMPPPQIDLPPPPDVSPPSIPNNIGSAPPNPQPKPAPAQKQASAQCDATCQSLEIKVTAQSPSPQPCSSALQTSGQNQAAINRALSNWATISSAAAANGIDPALLAAIGVRESGFQNVWQSGGGMGAGVFQIDLGANPNVTAAQAFNLPFAANYAAGMLASNSAYLASAFPSFTPGQLLQATAASYNFGVGNISGNPATIDQGSTNNNYGSNVVRLMQCFR